MANFHNDNIKWFNLVWGSYQEDRSEYEINEDYLYMYPEDTYRLVSWEDSKGYENFLDDLYSDEARVSHGRWIPTGDNQFNAMRPKEQEGYVLKEHRR